MTDLVMLVPSRGRPGSVARMREAWSQTGAFAAAGCADLIWILDRDDPDAPVYVGEIGDHPRMKIAWLDRWLPMVPKLDLAALLAAEAYPMVGFMGDDHLPRSTGWDTALSGYMAAKRTAIVYGRDGFQDEKLPTWWVMTSDIIKALGRMVPAPVQHMFCDNSVRDLGEQSGVLDYLPHVYIEHMHPVAGKAEWDKGYIRVNRSQQYERDGRLYSSWVKDGLARDAMLLRKLRGV